jgi:hypothetical protein
MKAELKQKWIEALRSGQYKQGNAYLAQTDEDTTDAYRHCCLGVLAECAGEPRARLLGNEILDDIKRTDLLDRWDFRDDAENESLQRRLAKMNDDGGLSFAEIADWIEKNVPVDA